MALQVYETTTLTRVVQRITAAPRFLKDMLFSQVQTSDDSKIHFDRERNDIRIMPYSSPDLPAQVSEISGFDTDSIVAPYLSEKSPIYPTDAVNRAMGEMIGGSLSPQQRQAQRVARELENKRRKLDRGLEKACAEELKTGQLVVVGENYPQGVIDFNRNAAQTNAAPATAWTDAANATPHADMESWAQLIADNSGITATMCIMPRQTYALLRATDEFAKVIDARRVQQMDMLFAPITTRENQATYVGMYGEFDLYVYNFNYTDWQNNAQSAFVVGDFMMTGGVDGVIQSAVILDEASGYSSQEFFAKSWVDEDPAIRWLLARSATMPIMYQPNGSLHADVD